MYKEYAIYDVAINEIELKNTIIEAVKLNIDGISVLPMAVKAAKTYIGNNFVLSCPIDYPMGLMDLKSRTHMVEQTIKAGANTIDLVVPSFWLCNRKYDKFREDIKTMLAICSNSCVKLRYFLEYRVYSHELLYKISQILADLGVTEAFPSSGYLLDNIYDNLLAIALINKKVSTINIICNGNIWHTDQCDMLKKANLYGLRVSTLHSLKLLKDHNF
jgi:deoxyribose-phosphate aldolase